MQLMSTDMIPQNATSVVRDLPTEAPNGSVPGGCTPIRFSEWEYLPWNNSDNIVSQEVPLYVAKVRSHLLYLLFLVGGPANIINMVVVFKQGLKDRVNLLLFTLSLSDELFLIAAALHCAEDVRVEFTKDPSLSPYFVFIINNNILALYGFAYVSFILSAMIACERCYCVLRPLQYQALQRTRPLALIITAVYVIIPGLQFLVISRYSIQCVYDPDTGAVFSMYRHSERYGRYWDLIDQVDLIVFGVGLQVGLLVAVITPTVITVVKLRQAVAWRAQTSSALSPKEVMLTKMLVGTSLLLIACVSPSCVVRVASLCLPEMNAERRNENLFLAGIYTSQLFAYINSSFNIVIYYVMGSRYRQTFWALLKRGSGQQKNDQ